MPNVKLPAPYIMLRVYVRLFNKFDEQSALTYLIINKTCEGTL